MAKCLSCKYTPGVMRQQIKIQKQVEAQDDSGAMTTTWSDAYTLWSKVTPRSGNETLIAQGIEADDVYEIVVKAGPTISEKHRVSYGSRILQIKSVIDIEELHEFLMLKCIDTGPGT